MPSSSTGSITIGLPAISLTSAIASGKVHISGPVTSTAVLAWPSCVSTPTAVATQSSRLTIGTPPRPAFSGLCPASSAGIAIAVATASA